ncbi:MAG: ATP-binding cassette domain-containing protein [Melioribacteraceae bacterium]|nr:ATP-binding cassette domain-containing protein [Melioribacteraceae bacterium]
MLTANINSITINNKTNTASLLRNVDFTLFPNNIYTILGKNGSGKSTLLLALVNLLDNNDFTIDGSIKLNDVNLQKLSESEFAFVRKDNFRFIFQDSISAFDPLKKIKYYFELFNYSLNEIRGELNYFQLPKYSEVCELYPHQISTGMAQRISIVLALLSNPNILLLDEPTSALDLPIINLLLHRLKKYVEQENKIVLLVTQDIPFAKAISDYISLMEEGELSQFITPENFFNKEV